MIKAEKLLMTLTITIKISSDALILPLSLVQLSKTVINSGSIIWRISDLKEYLKTSMNKLSESLDRMNIKLVKDIKKIPMLTDFRQRMYDLHKKVGEIEFYYKKFTDLLEE